MGGGRILGSCSRRLESARICAQQQQQQQQQSQRNQEQQEEESEEEEEARRAESDRKVSSCSTRDLMWPAGALQVVEAQMGLLSASTRDHEFQEAAAAAAAGEGESPSPKRKKWEMGKKNQQHKHKHIDLHPQQPALPYGWEQFLDLNTGEVYYIDWSTCKRTYRDPREMARIADDKIRALKQHHLQQSGFDSAAPSSSSSASSSSDTVMFPPRITGKYCLDYCSQADDEEEEEEASSSRRQPGEEHQHEDSSNVMVALGCHRCLMYFMLPRLNPVCPSCGAYLQVKI